MRDYTGIEVFGAVEPAMEKLQQTCPVRTRVQVDGLDPAQDRVAIDLLKSTFGSPRELPGIGGSTNLWFALPEGFDVQKKRDAIRAAFAATLQGGRCVVIQQGNC